MARRSDIDKEAVERDYRAGQLSFAAICAKHSISKSTLARFVAEGGWTRDLTEAVKVATRAGLTEATIAEGKEKGLTAPPSVERLVQEKVGALVEQHASTIAEGVDAAAAVNVQVVMGHRRDIQRLKGLAGGLFAELEAVVGDPVQLQTLINMVADQDPDALPTIMKLANVGNRIASAQKLVNTFQQLIGLERQAYGLDDDSKNGADGSVEDVLRAVHGLG